jgi:hypothetical protein
VVDGNAPYIINMQFLESSGSYSVDTVIHIEFEFSAPVIVFGYPRIRLETGAIYVYYDIIKFNFFYSKYIYVSILFIIPNFVVFLCLYIMYNIFR